MIPVGTNLPPPENKPIEFTQDFASDDDISLSGNTVATMQVPEGDIDPPLQETQPTPTAVVSSRGCVRKMSRAMQDSLSQRSFYGNCGMHYMGNRAIQYDLEEAEILYIREQRT